MNESFIQANSPDGGFLQSEPWRKFQELFGRKTSRIESEGFSANAVEHELPIVGKYLYVPRGPVASPEHIGPGVEKLVAAAAGAGWIRIEPASDEALGAVRKIPGYRLAKAPHDMQPRELWMMDISAGEEELLRRMKPKTRYNIRLAEKKGVEVFVSRGTEDVGRFLDLVSVTARRDRITAHPRTYYEKMLEAIPAGNLELLLARYGNRIIAGALVAFFGPTATYLHGASDDADRHVMAPYLIQWRAILEAKKRGCVRYDFGGVSSDPESRWSGITRFKQGFGPGISGLAFPGSYDIVLSPIKYWTYRLLQKLR